MRPRDEHEKGDPKSIAAISQCPTLLELVPSSLQALAVLEDFLPVFGLADRQQHANVEEDPGASRFTAGHSRLWKDIPLSNGQIEEAWRAICAFSIDGKSWRPDVEILLGLWKSIINAVLLKGHDLASGITLDEIRELVAEDGFPYPLLETVTNALGQSGGRDGERSKCPFNM